MQFAIAVGTSEHGVRETDHPMHRKVIAAFCVMVLYVFALLMKQITDMASRL